MARNPALARQIIWWRHEYHISGNPWRNTTTLGPEDQNERPVIKISVIVS